MMKSMDCRQAVSLHRWRTNLVTLSCLALMPFASTKAAFCQSKASGPHPARQQWASFANGGHWESKLPIAADMAPAILWQQDVGEGRSQVVADGEYLYVVSGAVTDAKAKPRKIRTTIAAVNHTDGTVVWQYKIASVMLGGQETFSGAKPCPRATPLLQGGRLVAVTFSGQLVCVNASDGKVLWQSDLVNDAKADPVQFGFTSSVVADPMHSDRIWVVAAGKDAGFYCLSAVDGSVIQKAECETFSYATPVLSKFGGILQWVVVTQNHVMGIAVIDGGQLWKYDMPKAGLTNVPTPLVLDDERLVMSGQGWEGTIAIQVTKTGKTWVTNKLWHSRPLQYFYTNWVKVSHQIGLGCTDKYLAAFDLQSGALLGRWRGFSDGNILNCNDGRYLILGGNGKLSLMKFGMRRGLPILSVESQFQLTDRRCWTPLSVTSGTLLARFDNQLLGFQMQSAGTETLKPIGGKARRLTIANPSGQSTGVDEDPVGQIFTVFETKGPQAAIQLYSQMRSSGLLNVDSRIALVEAARDAGVGEIGDRILQESLSDFPDSVRLRALKR